MRLLKHLFLIALPSVIAAMENQLSADMTPGRGRQSRSTQANPQLREQVIRSKLCNVRTCTKCLKITSFINLDTTTRPVEKRCIILLAVPLCCSQRF